MMTTIDRGYDSKIAHLENVISYGTLGILDVFAKHSNDNPNEKCNIFLINIMTIIRNVLNQKVPDNQILKLAEDEVEQIRLYYENYAPGKSHLIFYLQPNVYDLIPEHSRRKITDVRANIIKYSKLLMNGEVNKLSTLGTIGSVTYYGLHETRNFIYSTLKTIVKNSLSTPVAKVWMTSHCTIDYLLLESIPSMKIIDSHTGRICDKNDMSVKVFRNEQIPFNRTTLKMFGDNEFIAPLIKQRPKALVKLGRLNLKTEREIFNMAMHVLGIDREQLSWKL